MYGVPADKLGLVVCSSFLAKHLLTLWPYNLTQFLFFFWTALVWISVDVSREFGPFLKQKMHLRLHFQFSIFGQICSKQPFPHLKAVSGKRSPSAESFLVLTPHMLLNHSVGNEFHRCWRKILCQKGRCRRDYLK